MDVTVSVCTWNRAALLDRTLHTIAALDVPAQRSWEVLVVDNGSTDATQDVLSRHRDRLPLRSVIEPTPGHSNARNRVLAEAAGELILWLDDDVTVEPGWLRAWLDAADAWPDAAYFGGPIEPLYERRPPRWLVAHLDVLSGALALLDLGREIRPLAADELPYGANMAIRRSAVRAVPGGLRFDPNLGLVRDQHIRGEEVDVFERLRAAGGYGVWVGTAPVKHLVPRERATIRWMWRYFVGFGRTAVRRGAYGLGELTEIPAWMDGRFRWLLRTAAMRALVGRHDWVPALVEAAQLKGQIDELRAAGLRRAPRGRRRSGAAPIG